MKWWLKHRCVMWWSDDSQTDVGYDEKMTHRQMCDVMKWWLADVWCDEVMTQTQMCDVIKCWLKHRCVPLMGLCTLYLHACQVWVTAVDSGLCCCMDRKSTPANTSTRWQQAAYPTYQIIIISCLLSESHTEKAYPFTKIIGIFLAENKSEKSTIHRKKKRKRKKEKRTTGVSRKTGKKISKGN